MENKYHTPELEDLFIGYEIERYIAGSGDSYDNIILNKIELEWCLNCYNTNCQKGWLRTPYLTKEQIESEGWVFNYLGKDDWFKNSIPILPYNEIDYPFELWFKLDNYWLGFYKNIHKIVVLEKGEDYSGGQIIRFNGKCPSINEFRKIIKLLEI